MENLFYFATILLLIVATIVLLKTKKRFEQGKPLTKSIAIGWWIIDLWCTSIIIFSSLYGIWPFLKNSLIVRVIGVVVAVLGLLLLVSGMLEFHSIKKISGLEQSHLITTGIYKWSRNPQFLGWYLNLLGISLAGLSGYALLVSIVTIILCHYYIVRIEEPYLQKIFGKEYLKYKSRTPRYLKFIG